MCSCEHLRIMESSTLSIAIIVTIICDTKKIDFMPGRRHGFIDDDALFESNPSLWANMRRKNFVRTKYGFLIDDDIDIITAQ